MTKYVLISPVRNEEKYIEQTIQSVIAQSITPEEWFIVNDGSTDKTKEIIERYIIKYPWIRKVDLVDTGFKPGKGPAQAFNAGMKHITKPYDFIANLDGDILIDEFYFENIFKKFKENSKLGIATGKLYQFEGGALKLYRSSDDSTVGASKIYRKECFESIDSVLKEHMCWDMLDNLDAQFNGWETRSFIEFKITHLKPMGIQQGSVFKTYFINGSLLNKFGYHPLYVLFKSIYRIFDRPYMVRFFAINLGYLYSKLKNEHLIIQKEKVVFLRKQQMGRILSIFKFNRSRAV